MHDYNMFDSMQQWYCFFKRWSSGSSLWSLPLNLSEEICCPSWSWTWRTVERKCHYFQHRTSLVQLILGLWEGFGQNSRDPCKPKGSWSRCCRIYMGWHSLGRTGFGHPQILDTYCAMQQHSIGQEWNLACHCHWFGYRVFAWRWCIWHFLWYDSL